MTEVERAFKLMLTEYPDVLTVQQVAKMMKLASEKPNGFPPGFP